MSDETASDQEPVQKAAALCYRRKGASIEILLVRAHSSGWIFPKGGIQPGEAAWQAAEREAFEEAGVKGQIEHAQLTTFLHFKPGVNKEYRVAAFLLLVKSIQPPQEPERRPAWFSPAGAEQAIIQSRQLKYAEEYKRVIRLAVERLMKSENVKQEER